MMRSFATSGQSVVRHPRVTSHFFSKRWRCVYPQQPGLGAPGVSPPMRRGALEIEAVPRFEPVMFLAVQPDFKNAAKYVQELFAFVRVRLPTAPTGFDAKKMRLHHR